MKTFKKFPVIFFILTACVGCDQVTKEIARNTLADAGTLRFLSDTLRLQYAENSGAFLSLGAIIPTPLRYWVFSGVVSAALLSLLIYLLAAKKMRLPMTMALSLVLAGGCGNLLDRIFNNGRVVDFMNVGLGPLRTGIFNVADVAITAGVAWLF